MERTFAVFFNGDVETSPDEELFTCKIINNISYPWLENENIFTPYVIITLARAKVVGAPLLEVVGAPVVREGFLQRRRRATSLLVVLVVGTHLHTTSTM